MASLLEVWSLPGALIFIVCLTVNWTEYVSSRVPKPYLVSLHSGVTTDY